MTTGRINQVALLIAFRTDGPDIATIFRVTIFRSHFEHLFPSKSHEVPKRKGNTRELIPV